MQAFEGGGVAVADSQLAGLYLFRPKELLFDVALQINEAAKLRTILPFLIKAHLYLHFRMGQFHLLSFLQPRELLALTDADGHLGNVMKGVFLEILAIHIFQIECQVFAVAEVTLKGVLVLILNYLEGCAQKLAFLPAGIGGEGAAAHLAVLTRFSVLLEFFTSSAPHHQHNFDALLAHLYFNGLLPVPVDPLMVDADPITDLLFLAGNCDYPLREYEEFGVFASWIGFDGVVDGCPEVEVKRNGDGLVLDEIVEARLGRAVPKVCCLIALVGVGKLRH